MEEEPFKTQKCDAEDKKPHGIKEWIDYFQRNKPQVNSLAAGIMILIFGGQNQGWGIFNNHIRVQPWAGGYEDDGMIFWSIFPWFIANIFGFIVGSFIVNRYSKINIYIIASIISSISATCFILYPTSIYMIVFGRILAGVSYGIVYLVILIHASEVSVPELRGYHISVINLCTIIGVLMTSCSLGEVYKTRSYEIDPTKMLGYNGLVCILTGLLLALFLNRESPVYLIKNYKEKEALSTMMRLRSELHETISIKREFDELVLMVKEDSRSSINVIKYSYQFSVGILLKSIFVCTFNMPLNVYFLEIAKIHFYDGEVDKTGAYLLAARMTSILIFMFFIDFKRMKIFLLSSIGSAIVLIFLSFNEIKDESIYSAIIPIVFQSLAGIAIGNMSDIYAVDSVNTRFKPLYICLISIYEVALQMILTVTHFHFKIAISKLLTVFGIVIFFGLLAFPVSNKYRLLPDTSGLSLRRARNKFLGLR